jgi:hypothetical protein
MFIANCIWHTEYYVIKIYSNKHTQNLLSLCLGITQDWFTFNVSQSDTFSIQIATRRKVQHFEVNSKISDFYLKAIYNPVNNIFTLLSNTHCQLTVWKTTTKTEKYKQCVHCTNTSSVYTLQKCCAIDLLLCDRKTSQTVTMVGADTRKREREREKNPSQ